MTYLGAPVSQIDGSWAQNLNCVAAVTSELGDSSSLGYHRVPPSRIRSLSGDYAGGIDFGDAVYAMARGSNNDVNLRLLYWAPENSNVSTLDDLLSAPRIVGIIINCAYTRWTPFRTGTFTGAHAIAVGAKRRVFVTREDGSRVIQKQAYVMDPGRSNAKWVWWPWSLLIKAAHGNATSTSIHVFYTRDVADVYRFAAEDGAIRTNPRVDATKVGKVIKGRSYKVENTVRKGEWVVNGHRGKGWSKLGPNRFVNGGKLR